MTTAFILLIAAIALWAIIQLLIALAPMLFFSAICTSCGIAIHDLNQGFVGDFETFAMAGLMAALVISAVKAFQGFVYFKKKIGLA